MRTYRWIPIAFLMLILGACNQAVPPKPTPETKSGHYHMGRDWCAEHYMPESICCLCNNEYAAECKKKGDWCEEHDIAKSQCFKCDPKLKEKFAEQYRLKYNEDPPK